MGKTDKTPAKDDTALTILRMYKHYNDLNCQKDTILH